MMNNSQKQDNAAKNIPQQSPPQSPTFNIQPLPIVRPEDLLRYSPDWQLELKKVYVHRREIESRHMALLENKQAQETSSEWRAEIKKANEHRREIESREMALREEKLKDDFRLKSRRQWLMFSGVSLVLILHGGGPLFLIYVGNKIVGGILAGILFVGMIIMIIVAITRATKQDRKNSEK